MKDCEAHSRSRDLLTSDVDLFDRLCGAEPAFDAMGDGLIMVYRTGRSLFCNMTARLLLGNLPCMARSETWWRQYHFHMPEAGAHVPMEDIPLIRGLNGQMVTREVMHLSGHGIRSVWLSVTARPVMDDQGRFEWAYIVLRDVSSRHYAQERSRLLERAMGSTGEGVIIVDVISPRQPVIYVNSGFEHVTGRSKEEALNQDWSALLGKEQEETILNAIRRKDFLLGEPFITEMSERREDGRVHHYRLALSPLLDSNGAMTHFIAILSDITALMEAEQKVMQAHRRLEAAFERTKHDLEGAAKLQQSLLPTETPVLPGVRFAWRLEAAETLSGDILNILQLDEHHVAMYLLDVTGHGVAASMLSVTVSRSLIPLRSTTSLLYRSHGRGAEREFRVAQPAHVAARLAMRFPWTVEEGQFFTLVYGVLDIRTREFRYICAGHAPPAYLSPEGAWTTQRSKDLPIGLGGQRYKEYSLTLEPGSRLYLFSDGVPDTMHPNGSLFGQQRLLSTLAAAHSLSLQENLSCLMDNLKEWRSGHRPHDDAAVLAVEITTTRQGRP